MPTIKTNDAYKGGDELVMEETVGGHAATSTQRPIFPDFTRKLADPSPFAWMALGTSMLQYAVNNIGARGIDLDIAAVPIFLAIGSLVLLISTVAEYLSGRTFPATMFGVYGGFFGGYTILNIPWFGLTGSYDGTTANIYSGALTDELSSVRGLWLSTFVILTAILAMAAMRQSAIITSMLVSMELFFVLGMVDNFKAGPNSSINKDGSLAMATSAFAFITGILAMYMAAAALLTRESSYFTLPTFDFIKTDSTS